MRSFNLGDNNFYGKIPQELGRCTHLKILRLYGNNLIGKIPIQIGSLRKLTELSLYMNQLTGRIPSFVGNLSALIHFSLSNNKFEGNIPQEICRLKNLTFLALGDNSTNDLEFLKSLTNCSMLNRLDIGYNNFGGHLPNSLGNLSAQLSLLHLGVNEIFGEIPASLGNLIGLTLLTMEENHISGIIPTTFGKFQNMQVLDLNANKLSGEIGTFIGNFSQLFHLGMGGNMLEGKIPPSIGNCQKLQHLDLSHNNLRGTIPVEVFKYGVGSEVSMNGDMYSFGVLMLEMLTGRRPTDEIFEGGQNLYSFVKNSFPNNLLQILDPSLVPAHGQATIEEENNHNLTSAVEKCLISLIKVGLACSVESPNERMNIVDVTRELSKIRRVFLAEYEWKHVQVSRSNLLSKMYELDMISIHTIISKTLTSIFQPPLIKMKYFSLMFLAFWSIYFHLFSLFTLNLLWFGPNIGVFSLENETDYLALVKFRESIFTDPYEIFLSWNTSTHFCNWHGITCNPMHQRVIELNLHGYKLKGSISPHIGNLSYMRILSLSNNSFFGNIPQELGRLSQLQYLHVGNNSLVGKIPTNLTWGNQFSGKIPAELGNLKNLILLTMDNSHFKGIIPSSFGKFQKLQVLSLSVNKLSGHIGAFIGNLSQLFFFNIEENMLEGNIPPSIGDCQMLQYLFLSGNNFKGIMPLEVLNLSTLIDLTLSENLLSGRIPKEVGNLKNLNFLDISENRMFGDIPITIGECIMLEHLYLQGNSLHGIIPSSLASLKGLQRLDLSRNFLSGLIPKALENLYFLQYFNASFNMLDGEVPTEGVFRNASELVVTGNTKLCGGISELHLPLCPVKVKKLIAKPRKFKLIAVIVSVVAFILVLSIILTICWIRKRNKKPFLDSPTIDQLAKVSYQSLYNGTNGFSTTNLIGSGYFSSVYKGTLELEDKIVAIKVLNLQRKGAHKSFITECNALKNVKHRNLVQILTCCSSTDYKGQEFKALIFEYMRNGSLEQWLHPLTLGADRPMILNLDQRLNIMIDIASALHYLHHECEQLIIHSDLKPSNVLLDDDMTAHVSDFGIARLLLTINGTTSKHTSTIGIKGTLGYAPPEYGMGFEVSTCGDMYSFGILMLEMLTGKRPTDEMFQDGQNLCNFVTISFPDNLLQILDPHLIPTYETTAFNGNDWNLHPNIEKCLVSLFRIGLACSMESPNERMNVVDATRELNRIRKVLLVGE
uniref:non-specific serine/threonine protein kinase n=1 Tax=Cajanus cajan TaxID=3821 RepID=A0A151RUA1_CAJCA|nr:putative LRR receptor-like serine/threonine-protein kinase At3g47570 family [Cajanus cajan]